jgi:hypothetical protein
MFGKWPNRIVVFFCAVTNDAQSRNIPKIAVIFIFIVGFDSQSRAHKMAKTVRLVAARGAQLCNSSFTARHERVALVAKVDRQKDRDSSISPPGGRPPGGLSLTIRS